MAALILFGGGGDLAMRMLLPSLYFLEHDGLLPDDLKIIGAARSDETAEEYIAKVHDAVKAKAEADKAWDDHSWAKMKARLDYLAVDATSADSLKPLKDKVGDGEVTSFLAVSPSLYGRIVTAMKAAGLAERNCRIVLESRSGAISSPSSRSTTPWPTPSARTRYSASTTIWARRRSRT